MNPTPFLSFVLTALLANPPSAFAQTPPTPQPAPPAPAPATPPAPPVLDLGQDPADIAGSARNQPAAQGYAKKCIELYQAKAVEMQKAIAPAPPTVKEEIQKQWALNDVGTSYFILGQSLEAEGKAKEAAAAFKFLVENLSLAGANMMASYHWEAARDLDNLALAQCWDTKGWFWKPADAARERAKALEFEALDEAK